MVQLISLIVKSAVQKYINTALVIGLVFTVSFGPGCRINEAENEAKDDETKEISVDTRLSTNIYDTAAWNNDNTDAWPASFGFGRTATSSEIKDIDIDIMPNGHGLPPGSGTAEAGRVIYLAKCAACHGITGREGPNNKLVSAGSDTAKEKTIGNYWPYATTVFDYIRRAMPFNEPGSLTDAEVYNLTAYLLNENKIIEPGTKINAGNLARIKMPAQHLFVNDDRRGGPEVR